MNARENQAMRDVIAEVLLRRGYAWPEDSDQPEQYLPKLLVAIVDMDRKITDLLAALEVALNNRAGHE